MPWKNISQVEAEFMSSAHIKTINKLYSLHAIVSHSIFPENYKANPLLSKYITPSKHAREILDNHPEIEENFEKSELSLALLCILYHHEFMIEIESINADEVIKIISEEIRNNKILLPHRYGRDLYDRFNDHFNTERTEFLLSDDVEKLLAQTEQGVYHVGAFLAGPLGIIETYEYRYLPPSLRLPLWHCSDTGCNALHSVSLVPANSSLINAYQLLRKYTRDSLGPESEWEHVLINSHRRERWPKGRPYADLGILIGDAIIKEERRILLAHCISNDKNKIIRESIRNIPGKRKLSDGTPDQVAGNFSHNQQLQLLLLLDDLELVKNIDQCVYKEIIKIPANEVRKARTGSILISDYDQQSELSLHGVRSESRNALVSLASAIWEAYVENNLLSDLAWRCDKTSSIARPGIVSGYLRSHTPQDAISNLVLPSRSILENLATNFAILLIAGESEILLIERILWKIGFNSARYENEYILFRNRLSHFTDTLLKISEIKNENDREEIRSSGVNLFVSLEHILEEIVSYNVWMLSSDHFLDTKFKFSLPQAIYSVPKALGDFIGNGSNKMYWNNLGGNTLGALLSYLSATSDWINSLLEKNKSDIKRPTDDLPHFIEEKERIFPFLHLELWADASEEEIRVYSSNFEKITKLFISSNLAEIRNGLDHKRTDANFPTIDSMLACSARLGEAFNLADSCRFIPKTFWLFQKNEDIYGRLLSEARDYQKKQLYFYGPSEVSGLPILDFGEPVIIPSGNLLGIHNSEIMLRIHEVSSYTNYWDGYPRRRFIPAKEESVTEKELIEIPEELTNKGADGARL